MFTLELQHTGVDSDLTMGMTQVVQKRLDYIRYNQRVPTTGVGVEFLAWDKVDANDIVKISDLSASIPENSSLVFDDGITVSTASVLNVTTLNVLITDQVSVKNDGTVVPLFYRHRLSVAAATGTVSLQAIRWDGLVSVVDPIHYTVSADGRDLYTDLKNSFDEETGRYTI